MYKEHLITAVVPAYNEQKLIAKTIATMPDFVDRIIVVDDKSTDSTVAMAESVGDPRVIIVQHDQNKGVGGAILTGHRSALEIGGDIDVVMAGDAQMDPDYLPSLLDPIVEEGYGFTKANRFFSRDSFRGMPAYRIVGNIVLSFLTKMASGYWHLLDPQNGYTAIRHDVLRRLALDRIAIGYHFENDLLINLSILRVRARDVPIPAVYGDEVSAMRLSRVIPQIGSLLFVGFWKRILLKYVLWSFSPIALLLFTGFFLVLWGVAWGVFAVVNALQSHSPSAATSLLSVAPLMTGIYMLVQALILDIQETS
ncbi:MAG: glycosyltransferase family 2 protein, partial [Mycobacteriales bacterium]